MQEDFDDESEEQEGTEKGNALGGSKAPYARGKFAGLYDNIRHLDPDVLLFEGTIHLTREDFDALHVLFIDALLSAMYVKGDHEGVFCCPCRRRLDAKVMFMFLDVIGEGMREEFLYSGLAIDMMPSLKQCPATFGTLSSLFLESQFS